MKTIGTLAEDVQQQINFARRFFSRRMVFFTKTKTRQRKFVWRVEQNDWVTFNHRTR